MGDKRDRRDKRHACHGRKRDRRDKGHIWPCHVTLRCHAFYPAAVPQLCAIAQGALNARPRVAWGLAMTGGRAPRRKGQRIERLLVRSLQAHSFAAERVPLSGATGGRFSGDFVIPLTDRDLSVEVKARADGFRDYSWLNGRDVLIVKADRREPLVVVRLSLAAEIAKAVT